VLGIANLADDPEPVGLVAGLDLGVQGEGGLELGQRQLPFHPEHLDPLPENVERAPLVDRVSEPMEERLAGLGPVVLHEGFPGFFLWSLDPRQDVVGKEGQGPVVAARIPLDVDPAVGAEVLADLLLEGLVHHSFCKSCVGLPEASVAS
jgi:hypothetical protein